MPEDTGKVSKSIICFTVEQLYLPLTDLIITQPKKHCAIQILEAQYILDKAYRINEPKCSFSTIALWLNADICRTQWG